MMILRYQYSLISTEYFLFRDKSTQTSLYPWYSVSKKDKMILVDLCH